MNLKDVQETLPVGTKIRRLFNGGRCDKINTGDIAILTHPFHKGDCYVFIDEYTWGNGGQFEPSFFETVEEAKNVVETTPERILEAASKCPVAKEALKTLFPEVFKKYDLTIDLRELKIKDPSLGSNPSHIIVEQENGDGLIFIARSQADTNMDGKQFLLSKDFDWKLEKNKFGNYWLTPTNKIR